MAIDMTLLNQAQQNFQTTFGRSAEVAVQSPGRINLIGEHIDYLDGWVMPAAIDRHLVAVAAPLDKPVVRLWSGRPGSTGSSAPVEISLDDLSRHDTTSPNSWLNYVVGVLVGYRNAGIDLPGFEAALESNLPSGAGLSSSAALETITALLIEALTEVAQDPVDRALICQQAEHDFVGVPCGIMDQLAVGVGEAGHALKIDCRDHTFTKVPMPENAALVVADTGVKHALADGEYRQRREDCERATAILGLGSLREATMDLLDASAEVLGDSLLRRARHAVTEMARVHDFSTALGNYDSEAIGRLMRASHNSLRDDFEVSCAELDSLVDAAYDFGHDRGLLGARMTGGGFGGSTINLVHRDAAESFIEHLNKSYTAQYNHPLQAFETSASAGASILPRPL
jgi:galactokinase